LDGPDEGVTATRQRPLVLGRVLTMGGEVLFTKAKSFTAVSYPSLEPKSAGLCPGPDLLSS
jgi:hypothetical protein